VDLEVGGGGAEKEEDEADRGGDADRGPGEADEQAGDAGDFEDPMVRDWLSERPMRSAASLAFG